MIQRITMLGLQPHARSPTMKGTASHALSVLVTPAAAALAAYGYVATGYGGAFVALDQGPCQSWLPIGEEPAIECYGTCPEFECAWEGDWIYDDPIYFWAEWCTCNHEYWGENPCCRLYLVTGFVDGVQVVHAAPSGDCGDQNPGCTPGYRCAWKVVSRDGEPYAVGYCTNPPV